MKLHKTTTIIIVIVLFHIIAACSTLLNPTDNIDNKATLSPIISPTPILSPTPVISTQRGTRIVEPSESITLRTLSSLQLLAEWSSDIIIGRGMDISIDDRYIRIETVFKKFNVWRLLDGTEDMVPSSTFINQKIGPSHDESPDGIMIVDVENENVFLNNQNARQINVQLFLFDAISVTFLPTGGFLAIGRENNTLWLLSYDDLNNLYRDADIENPDLLFREEDLPPYQTIRTKSPIIDVVFSPEGSHMAVITDEGVELWETNNWTLREIITIKETTTVSFSHDGTLLAVGAKSGNIDLFSVTDIQRIRTLQLDNGAVSDLDISQSGRFLVAADYDDTIYVWGVLTAIDNKGNNGITATLEKAIHATTTTMIPQFPTPIPTSSPIPTCTSTFRPIGKEDYYLLSTIINTDESGYMNGSPKIILKNTTKGDTSIEKKVIEWIMANVEDVDVEALYDFMGINNQIYSFTRQFTLKTSYILLDDFIDYDLLSSKYPQASGEILFSRIGFNSDFTHALLFVEVYCGGTCGAGRYYVLEKEENTWIITNIEMMWIA